MSELREVIGALQSEAEFEAAVSESGAAGIDRARGHCRVVRRRRCRPGNDWRSVRADALATLASGGSVGGLAALFGAPRSVRP